VPEVVPFQTVCVDLFGPYRAVTKDQKLRYVKLTDLELDAGVAKEENVFYGLSIICPATGFPELIEVKHWTENLTRVVQFHLSSYKGKIKGM
jgi:hypothetical protein